MSNLTEKKKSPKTGVQTFSSTDAEQKRTYFLEQERMRCILGRISYKPEVEAILDNGLSPFLLVRVFFRYQAYDVNEYPKKVKTAYISKYTEYDPDELGNLSDRGIATLIFNEMRQIEEHELKEWFFFDGEQLENPHPDRPPLLTPSKKVNRAPISSLIEYRNIPKLEDIPHYYPDYPDHVGDFPTLRIPIPSEFGKPSRPWELGPAIQRNVEFANKEIQKLMNEEVKNEMLKGNWKWRR